MSLSKFAHLLGFSAKASDDDEEKEKARRVEEEEQEGKAKEDEDEDKKPESTKSKKAEKAEGEQDDTAAEEDEDDEDKESDDVKKGRKAENKRCAAIFASQHAAGNVGMAAHLAFETRMSASEAIGVLKMAGASVQPASKIALDQRMSALTQPKIGQDAPAKSVNVADQMKDVYNRATQRGEK